MDYKKQALEYREMARKFCIIAFFEFVIIVGMIIGFVIALVGGAKATDYEVPVTVEKVADEAPKITETEKKVSIAHSKIPTGAPLSNDIPLSYELQQAVIDNCEEYGLEPKIVLGIMDVESDFRLKIDNGICYGVMQIHKGNQNWVKKNCGVTDIFDPAQNIRAGCWILSEGIRLHSDIEKALVWYNAGEVYADSTYYSRQVLRDAEKWGALITYGT